MGFRQGARPVVRLAALTAFLISGWLAVKVLAAVVCGLYAGVSWERHGFAVLLDWTVWSTLTPFRRELYLGLEAALLCLVAGVSLTLALRVVENLAG